MNNQAQVLSEVCGLDYFVSNPKRCPSPQEGAGDLVVLAQFEADSKAQQLVQEILDYFQLKPRYLVPFTQQQSLDDALCDGGLKAIEDGARLMIFADRGKLPLTKAKISGNIITTLCIKKLLQDGIQKKQLYKRIQEYLLCENR